MFHYRSLIHFCLFMSMSLSVSAEVTLDGSLGPKQALPGPDYLIGVDLGTQAGNNLFHSFGQFNINAGESATFTGPAHIANIIGRVTGSSPSIINGALNSTIPTADLYLLNPNGVLMGPNAKLNIDGAFHLSSADSLHFSDGTQFDANSTTPPLLSVASPESFGFLENNIGIIIIESQLDNKDKDFSVTARYLQIINSQIQSTTEDEKAGNFLFTAQQMFIGNSSISSTTQNGQTSYFIFTAQQMLIENSSINSTTQNGQAGAIYVQADDSLEISGYSPDFLTGLWTLTMGKGNGGNITINTPNLSITGNAGIVTQTKATGNAGDIEINVNELNFQDGGRINASSDGIGHNGNITVNVADSATIAGQSFPLSDGRIQPSAIGSSAFGRGDGGTIRITVGNKLTLDKRGTIQTLTRGEGNASDIDIEAKDLTITNGAKIDASNEGTGPSKGGHITINATGTVFITAEPWNEENEFQPIIKEGFSGGIYSAAKNVGLGGDVTLSAKQLILREGGAISVGSIGLGHAGKLTLHIDEALTMNNADIIARSMQAGGGDIEIGIPNHTHLMNSKITTDAQGMRSQDKGGNIVFKNQAIFTLDNSQLLANAYAGNGGTITIETPEFKVLGDSALDVSSELGFNGDFILNATKLTDAFLSLPPPQFQNIELSLSRCAGLTKEELSQFIITIRDVSPPSPSDLKTHFLFSE